MTKEQIEKMIEEKLAALGIGGGVTTQDSGGNTPKPTPTPTPPPPPRD